MVDHFFETARERYRIRMYRLRVDNPPWTNDRIFQQYRFCNVHREHDRTTQWFAQNIRSQIIDSLRLVEAIIIFRWFNRIETGERVKDLLLNGWNTCEAAERLRDVKPIVTGAYMIKTLSGVSKLEGLLKSIDIARKLLPQIVAEIKGDSLHDVWKRLQYIPYLGPFMSYEVVTDLRWTPLLSTARDIMTWANPGPGAAHGLGRLVNGNHKLFNRHAARDRQEMLLHMRDLLRASQDETYWPKDWTPWEMREVEHWLCEYDKYCRATQGHSLKRRFP
jgi:hypothetical protein